jgi:secreted trypsin-like serine protease
MRRFLVCTSMLFAVGCGAGQESTSDVSIVGGEAVKAADEIAKSTVGLIDAKGSFFCSGSLIAADLVVTAAHCLTDYTGRSLGVMFGLDNKSSVQMKAAKTFVVHTAFNLKTAVSGVATSQIGDIALIKLYEAAPAGYGAVKVAESNQTVALGGKVTLAGFGTTSAFWGRSGQLRKVVTTVTGVNDRAQEFDVGGTPGKMSCSGDSGGPALLQADGKMVLLGVTSRGDAYCYRTGIYTDLRKYGGWLTAATNALNGG